MIKPKLSEWHIYGNEQQGRFSVRKPENELHYLDNISNDVISKNFCTIEKTKTAQILNCVNPFPLKIEKKQIFFI